MNPQKIDPHLQLQLRSSSFGPDFGMGVIIRHKGQMFFNQAPITNIPTPYLHLLPFSRY